MPPPGLPGTHHQLPVNDLEGFLGGLGIEAHGHQPIGVALFAVLILLNLTRLVLVFRSKPSGF